MANETTPKITGWTKNGQPIEAPDRKYAVDEIGEGQVAYREYLDSRTPESIAALQAEIAKPHPLSPLLSDLDQWIVDESTRGLGDRGK